MVPKNKTKKFGRNQNTKFIMLLKSWVKFNVFNNNNNEFISAYSTVILIKNSSDLVFLLTNPRMPFSLCKLTLILGGIKLLASIGIPIPRLAVVNLFRQEK